MRRKNSPLHITYGGETKKRPLKTNVKKNMIFFFFFGKTNGRTMANTEEETVGRDKECVCIFFRFPNLRLGARASNTRTFVQSTFDTNL